MDFTVRDLGRMRYAEAFALQKALNESVIARETVSTLLLVEHDPVITLGANFHEENLTVPRSLYEAQGIEIATTDRGGDVTYHGPGQLVAYPIFDLTLCGQDLHWWMRDLESAVILALGAIGVTGTRNKVNTGVWVENRKICAMGVKVRKWVSMHGIAINCDNDLAPFGLIVPCGIRGDYGVTTASKVLGRTVTVFEMKPHLVEAFRSVFAGTMSP